MLSFFCREKFQIGKNCRFHCSWKLVALSLTALTLVLSSVIAYFGGRKMQIMQNVVNHLKRSLGLNFSIAQIWCFDCDISR